MTGVLAHPAAAGVAHAATTGQPVPFASWHTPEALFLCLSVVTLGSAVLVVSSRNVFHAALWLVVCLGTLAGSYLLLTAEFVAWVQVLLYVGAVTVMLLFATMLTQAPAGQHDDLDHPRRWPAALVGLGTAATLATLVATGFQATFVDLGHPVAIGTAQADGQAIFRDWVLPFEVVSVLLLAALVGAIVLTRRGAATAGLAVGNGEG